MIIFIILGFVSCIFQLVLIREFTFSIAKNELALIAGLGLWLIFCSLGALARGKKKFLSDAGLLVAFALSFGVGVVLAHTSKTIFHVPYYESVSIVFAFCAALLILGPTGMISGYAFAHFSEAYTSKYPDPKNALGYFFAYEALGVFVGGVVLTFAFANYQNPLSFAALPLLFAPVVAMPHREKTWAVVILMILSLALANQFPKLLQKEFAPAAIVVSQGSPYGPVILTDNGRVKSLYTNGTLTATSEDKEAHELLIHTALAARSNTQTLLWIGPCMTSQGQELEKYPQLHVTAVDINPRLNNVPSFYAPGANIDYHTQDPRAFLALAKTRYEMILLNIPAPSTLLFNRFFTVEFFREVKEHLLEDGVFVLAIPSKPDILSPSIRDFNACLVHSLEKVFAHRLLIPGDALIVMASQHELTAKQVSAHFKEHAVKTQYLTPFLLDDKLNPEKKTYVESALKAPAGLNKDLMPYGFLYENLMDQARFSPGMRIAPLALKPGIFAVSLLLTGLLGFLFLFKQASWARLQAGVIGFLAMQASAVVFFMFQLLWGGLFWKLGILVGLFMLGLAAGSFFLSRMIQKITVSRLHVAGLFLLWFIFFVEMLFWANNRGYSIWFEIIWLVLALESGLLTGLGYPLLGALWRQNNAPDDKTIAPALYAADLIGACAGTILASSVFIPFLGINLMGLVVFGVIAVLGLKDWLLP